MATRLPIQLCADGALIRNYLGKSIKNKFSIYYEPLALSSPFASPIGSTRTRRRLNTKIPKLPELAVDKRFPFQYTHRHLPTILEKPGDLDKTLGFVDKSRYKMYFQDSEELKTASDEVKRIFTLGLGTHRDIMAAKTADMRENIQRNRLDSESEEIKIGKKTLTIRKCYGILKYTPHDKLLKSYLHVVIAKRNSLLNKLRRKDEDRYNWILKTLEIDHETPPLGINILKPTRTLEIARLTEEYCEQVKKSKLEEYKANLKAQQANFLEDKKKLTEWISQQEKSILEKRQQLQMEEEQFWQKKDCRKH